MDGWEALSLFYDPRHPAAGCFQRLVCVARMKLIPAFVHPPDSIIFPFCDEKR